MKCEDIKLRISEFIDNMLNEEETKMFQDHLLGCEECNIYYQNFRLMIESLNEIDLVEPPINFNEQLTKRLEKEKNSVLKNILSYKKPILAIAAMLVVAVISVPLLSNMNINRQGSQSELARDMASEEKAAGYDNNQDGDLNITSESGTNEFMALEDSAEDVGIRALKEDVSVERKIIRNGSLFLEVDAFDEVYNNIVTGVESNDGYIQSSEISYHSMNNENPEESLKSAYIVIRVPNHKFLETFNNIKALGITKEEAISGNDITEDYLNTENEIANLKIQEDRLREILKKADKVDDILRIENELNRVRGQINSMDSSLRNYDKLVSLSTISLHVRQVKPEQLQLQPVSTGILSKAKNNFINTLNKIISIGEGIFVGLFALLPIGMVLALIAVPAWTVFNRKKNK